MTSVSCCRSCKSSDNTLFNKWIISIVVLIIRGWKSEYEGYRYMKLSSLVTCVTHSRLLTITVINERSRVDIIQSMSTRGDHSSIYGHSFRVRSSWWRFKIALGIQVHWNRSFLFEVASNCCISNMLQSMYTFFFYLLGCRCWLMVYSSLAPVGFWFLLYWSTAWNGCSPRPSLLSSALSPFLLSSSPFSSSSSSSSISHSMSSLLLLRLNLSFMDHHIIVRHIFAMRPVFASSSSPSWFLFMTRLLFLDFLLNVLLDLHHLLLHKAHLRTWASSFSRVDEQLGMKSIFQRFSFQPNMSKWWKTFQF